jgi:hypothetical protein
VRDAGGADGEGEGQGDSEITDGHGGLPIKAL